MKRWTLPDDLACIADIYVMPLLLGHRSAIAILDDEALRPLLVAICLNRAEAGDVSKATTSEDRIAASYRYLGRETLKGVVAAYILEKMGYNMGGNPPSTFLLSHPLPIVKTSEEAEALGVQIYDLNNPYRAAAYDWSIYIDVNGLREKLFDEWYYNSDKAIWRHRNGKNDVRLFFR